MKARGERKASRNQKVKRAAWLDRGRGEGSEEEKPELGAERWCGRAAAWEGACEDAGCCRYSRREAGSLQP